MAGADVSTLDPRSTLAWQEGLSKELILSLQVRRVAQPGECRDLAGRDAWAQLLANSMHPGESRAVYLLTKQRLLTTLLAQLHVLDTVQDYHPLSRADDTKAQQNTCLALDSPWQHLQHLEHQQTDDVRQPAQLLELVLFLLNALDAHEAFTNKRACETTVPGKLPPQQRSSKAAAKQNSFGTEWALRCAQPPLAAGRRNGNQVQHVGTDTCLLALPYAMHLLCHAVSVAQEQSVLQKQQQQVAATHQLQEASAAEQAGACAVFGGAADTMHNAASHPTTSADRGTSVIVADAVESAQAASGITVAQRVTADPATSTKHQQDSVNQVLGALPDVWARCAHHLWLRPVVPGLADVPVYLPHVLHTHSVLQRWGNWAAAAWQLAPPPVLSVAVWGAVPWQQLQARYTISLESLSAARCSYTELMHQLQALRAHAHTAAAGIARVQQRQIANVHPSSLSQQAGPAEEAAELSSRMLLHIDTWTSQLLSLDAWKLVLHQQELQSAPLSGHNMQLDAAFTSASGLRLPAAQPRNAFSQQELATVLELVSYVAGMKAALQEASTWLQPLHQHASQTLVAQVASCQALRHCAAGGEMWACTPGGSDAVSFVSPPTPLPHEIGLQPGCELPTRAELAAMGPLTRGVRRQQIQQQVGSGMAPLQIPQLHSDVSQKRSQPGTNASTVDQSVPPMTTRSGTDVAPSMTAVTEDDMLSSDEGMAYWVPHDNHSNAASSCLLQEPSLFYPASAHHQHAAATGSPQLALATVEPSSSNVSTPQTGGLTGNSSRTWHSKPTSAEPAASSTLTSHNLPASIIDNHVHSVRRAGRDHDTPAAPVDMHWSACQLQHQLSNDTEPAASSGAEARSLMINQHVSSSSHPSTSQGEPACNVAYSATEEQIGQQEEQLQAQAQHEHQLHVASAAVQLGDHSSATPSRGSERPRMPGDLTPGMPGFAWFDVSSGSGLQRGRPLGEGLEGWADIQDGDAGEAMQLDGEQQDTLLGLLLQPSGEPASQVAGHFDVPATVCTEADSGEDNIAEPGGPRHPEGLLDTELTQADETPQHQQGLAGSNAAFNESTCEQLSHSSSIRPDDSITPAAPAVAASPTQPGLTSDGAASCNEVVSRPAASKKGMFQRLIAAQASEKAVLEQAAPATATAKQRGLPSFLRKAGKGSHGLFGSKESKQHQSPVEAVESRTLAPVDASAYAAVAVGPAELVHGIGTATPALLHMLATGEHACDSTATGVGSHSVSADAACAASTAQEISILDGGASAYGLQLAEEQVPPPPSQAELESAALQAQLAESLQSPALHDTAALPLSAFQPKQVKCGKGFGRLFSRTAKTAPAPLPAKSDGLNPMAALVLPTSLPPGTIADSPAPSPGPTSQQPFHLTSPHSLFASLKKVGLQAQSMQGTSHGIGAQHRQHVQPAGSPMDAQNQIPAVDGDAGERKGTKAPLIMRPRALAKKLKHALMPGKKQAAQYTAGVPVGGMSITDSQAATAADLATGEGNKVTDERLTCNSMVGSTMLWSAAYELESPAVHRLAAGQPGAALSTAATSLEDFAQLATEPALGEDPAPVVSVVLAAAQNQEGAETSQATMAMEHSDARVSAGLSASSDPINLSWDPPSPSSCAPAASSTAAAMAASPFSMSTLSVAYADLPLSRQVHTEEACAAHDAETQWGPAGNLMASSSPAAAAAAGQHPASAVDIAAAEDTEVRGSLSSIAEAGPTDGPLPHAGPSHLSPVQEQQESPESPPEDAAVGVSPVHTPRQSGLLPSQPSMLSRARSFFTRNLSKKSRAESEYAAVGAISALTQPSMSALEVCSDGQGVVRTAVAPDQRHAGSIAAADAQGAPLQQPGTMPASPFADADPAATSRARSLPAVSSHQDLGRSASLMRSPSHWVRKWRSQLSSSNAAATDTNTTDAGKAFAPLRAGLQVPAGPRRTAEQQESTSVPARSMAASAPARMFTVAAAAARQHVAKLQAMKAIQAGMSNIRSLAQEVLQEAALCAGGVSHGLFALVSLLQAEVQQLMPQVLQAHRSGHTQQMGPEPLALLHELESLQQFCASFLPATSTMLVLLNYPAQLHHASSLSGLMLQHASSCKPLQAAAAHFPQTRESEEASTNHQDAGMGSDPAEFIAAHKSARPGPDENTGTQDMQQPQAVGQQCPDLFAAGSSSCQHPAQGQELPSSSVLLTESVCLARQHLDSRTHTQTEDSGLAAHPSSNSAAAAAAAVAGHQEQHACDHPCVVTDTSGAALDTSGALALSLDMSVPLALCHTGVELVAAKQLPVALVFMPLQLAPDVSALLHQDVPCQAESNGMTAAALGAVDDKQQRRSSSSTGEQHGAAQAATDADMAGETRGSTCSSFSNFNSQLRSHLLSSVMSVSDALARAMWASFLEAAALQRQHVVPLSHPSACTAQYNDIWNSNHGPLVISNFHVKVELIMYGALKHTIEDAAAQLVALLEYSCDVLLAAPILAQYQQYNQAVRLLRQHAGRLPPWEWFWRRAIKAMPDTARKLPGSSSPRTTNTLQQAAHSPGGVATSNQGKSGLVQAITGLQQELHSLHNLVQNGKQQHGRLHAQEDRVLSALCSHGSLQVMQGWSLDLRAMQLVQAQGNTAAPAKRSAGGVAVVMVQELGPLAKAAQLRAAKQQLQQGMASVPCSPFVMHAPQGLSSNDDGSTSSQVPGGVRRTGSELGVAANGATASAPSQWQQVPQQLQRQQSHTSQHQLQHTLQPPFEEGHQAESALPVAARTSRLTVDHYLALTQISHPHALSVVAQWQQAEVVTLLQFSVLPALQRIVSALCAPACGQVMVSQSLTQVPCTRERSDRVRRETVEVVSPPVAPGSAAQLLSEWTKHHTAVSSADWATCLTGLALLGNLMAAFGTLDSACMVHQMQSSVWAAAHLGLAPASTPDTTGLLPTDASQPAAIRQRVLGHNLPAMHGGMQLHTCDAAHLLVDHMAMDAWQTLQPRSFAPGLLQGLKKCVMEVIAQSDEQATDSHANLAAIDQPEDTRLTCERAAQGCCAAVLQLCLELAAGMHPNGGQAPLPGPTAIPGRHVCSALYGAAVLLHLTGCHQQLPLYNHAATILQLSQQETACAHLLGTARASTGGHLIEPYISGSGGLDVPLPCFLMAAGPILQDFESACSSAACLMQSMGGDMAAKQAQSSAFKPPYQELSLATGKAQSAADFMDTWSHKATHGQTVLPAWNQGGAERTGHAKLLDAKARAAAWGYKVDWMLRAGAPSESLDVSASVSDTRFRDQQLDTLIRERMQG